MESTYDVLVPLHGTRLGQTGPETVPQNDLVQHNPDSMNHMFSEGFV